MTACLKQRVIVDAKGKPRKDGIRYYVGWNHDFVANGSTKKDYGWTFINLKDDGKCRPRYQPVNFQWLFGGLGRNQDQPCSPCPTEATPITDADLCGAFDVCTPGGGGGGGIESGSGSASGGSGSGAASAGLEHKPPAGRGGNQAMLRSDPLGGFLHKKDRENWS